MKKILAICLLAVSLYSFKAQTDYETTTIGSQVWMTQNLNVDKFQNGDNIYLAKNQKAWEKANGDNKPAYFKVTIVLDGKEYSCNLYNWYAVTDKRGLAPAGWHIPGIKEYKQLIETLGGEKVAGNKLKSKSGWSENFGTNTSGFNALPVSYINYSGIYVEPGTSKKNAEGLWWCSEEQYGGGGTLWLKTSNISPYPNVGMYMSHYTDGLAIRCLKD